MQERLPSAGRTVSIQPAQHGCERRSRDKRITERSRSGEGRATRLKCRAGVARKNESRIRQWMRAFESLRDRQRRRCCGHGCGRHGDDSADGAKIIRMLILVARRRQLLRRLDRRRGLRSDCVDVAERKRKLDDERKQCRPRAKPDVRPYPLHVENAPRRKSLFPVGSDVTV